MTAMLAAPGLLFSAIDDDLVANLRDVARSAIPRDPGEIRTHRDSPDGFDRDLWRRFADLGWLGLTVAEDRGGAGAGENAVVAVAHELGRAGRPEPYGSAGVLVPACLAALAPSERGSRLLASMLSGTTVAALAWQPASGPSYALSRPVLATRTCDGLVLDGTVRWVPTGGAETFLVAASCDEETVLIEVERGHLGVEPMLMADRGQWGHVVLDGTAAAPDAVLGRGQQAVDALHGAVDVATMATAAELVGLANRMLELTCAYLSDRTQFGKPIGTFQALQHKAVDMWVQVQLAEAALAEALAVRADPDHDPTVAVAVVSSAKARASAAASTVGNQAIQLHGAIGFTDEYELGHLVNRSLVLAAWLGNAREHTRRFADLTRERAS